MKKFRFLGLIACMFVFVSAWIPTLVMQHGLDNPEPIGPFLNGNLPVSTPSSITVLDAENAFPHLTFIDPLQLVELPGENKFWLAGKTGLIWAFDNDSATTIADIVLDIEDAVVAGEDAGLLGMVLHPEFGLPASPNRGYVYLYYRHAPSGLNPNGYGYLRLSRFTRPDGVDTIDLQSELVLVQQFDRQEWHNGGSMFFDGDGLLYLSVGDEGGTDDVFNSTQKIDQSLFSGILRIDVDNDSTRSHVIRRQPLDPAPPPAGWPGSFTQGYLIPNDNPWLDPNGGILEEFFAIGLRSPHRMSYDSLTGEIHVADVGQGSLEEVSLAVKGANLQWPYREGSGSGPKAKPDSLIGFDMPPLHAYTHLVGSCVIGGFVYRGNKWASVLGGKYIFADHGVRNLWTMEYDDFSSTAQVDFLANVPAEGVGGKSGISSLGTDAAGEVYILKLFGTNLDGGKIYKLKPATVIPEPPNLLSQTGAFKNLATLEPQDGFVPYRLNVPFWSDGAIKSRWMAIPNDGSHDTVDEQIVFLENGAWQFPQGAVFMKHFELPIDESNPGITRRLETRFLVHGDDGKYYGVTYRWRDDQSDAELLINSRIDTLSITTLAGSKQVSWYYPSRQDCNNCHNEAASSVLGANTRQLNCELLYPKTGRIANQLTTLEHLNMFVPNVDTQNLQSLLTAAPSADISRSLEDRARSYIDANCASCHRPGTGIQANFDARLSSILGIQGLIYGEPENNHGIPGANVIVPQDLEHSLLYQRIRAVHNPLAMPPLAKNEIDKPGLQLIADWIMSIDPNYVEPPCIVDLPQTGWALHYVSSEEDYLEDGRAINAIDGDPNTYWRAQWSSLQPAHPHDLQIALGVTQKVAGLKYLPRQDGNTEGIIVQCEIYLSMDGAHWGSPVAQANWAGDDSEKQVLFAPQDAAYVRFLTLAEINGQPWGSAGEINLLQAACDIHGQSITFEPLPNKNTTDGPFALTATASSGLPVNYSVVSGPASLSGNILTLTGQPGKVVVHATQSGDATFDPAPFVERTFWVFPAGSGAGTGLFATYYDQLDFQSVAFSRVDTTIDFYWGSDPPDPVMDYETFSVVWEGEIEAPVTGTVTFTTLTDDGVRLYIDGQLIIDHWADQSITEHSASFSMNAWEKLPIRMEYYDQNVYAGAQLYWAAADLPKRVIPQYFLYPDTVSQPTLSEIAVDPDRIRVFPNPLDEQRVLFVELDLPEIRSVRIELIDIQGTQVLSRPIRMAGTIHREEISVETLSAGMYLLQVRGGQSIWQAKVLIFQ